MSLWESIVGCQHERYTWPLSVKRGRKCRPYVCCLECGTEFAYSWEEMRIIGKSPVQGRLERVREI